MSQPTFYSENYTPLPQDTLLRTWKKILGWYQSQSGADTANDPLAQETLRQTKVKVLQAQRGFTGSGISIPADYYGLVDESGNYLTDESGNILIAPQ